ncbi:ribosomal large subunit pseudouridine synthase D [Moraxella macacae 0408225]|uniref:Pseudouridine synthase n=1 Tax=Moraxella macacae 0408225 TaxID=1230338 RepID=L2F730_9GAMM|nr:RluA family pseudouridine synthase [Moraxella macacae]ELA08263.1 ribosomal large subunit pseudouridine synthase D [Moraxella macacae 0408225]
MQEMINAQNFTDFDKPNSTTICENYQPKEHEIGERIDKIAALAFHDYSREQIKTWLDAGELTVNGLPQKPKYRLKLGDTLQLKAVFIKQQADLPENIDLHVIYEDDSVLVINKPAGMVVHAGAGNWTGTLVNALLYHYPNSRLLPRAGLVHRIDKDTTGLMVIAKDHKSQLHLINQLKNKSVYRHYQALVLATHSELAKHRTITGSIARHPVVRTKMAVIATGKPAITHLDKIEQICDGVSLVSIRLETGRTHQIRVHFSNLGFALVGDPVYGSDRRMAMLAKQLTDDEKIQLNAFNRQALHAYELGFIHPKTGESRLFQAPMPDDLQLLIKTLRIV